MKIIFALLLRMLLILVAAYQPGFSQTQRSTWLKGANYFSLQAFGPEIPSFKEARLKFNHYYEIDKGPRIDESIIDIDNLLQWEEKFGFSGSVLIVKDGKTVLSKGYGFANTAKGIKNTPQTAYYIASVSKPITAMAIMKLVEQKKVRLDDALPKYFSGVPKNRRGISVEQLLTHTSGLDHTYSCDEIASRELAIKIILNETPQLSAPGTKFNYSGDNYTLLAAIIEIASKDTFENYVSKNILAPAGISFPEKEIPAFVGGLNAIAPEQLALPIDDSYYRTLNDIKPTWGRKGRAGMVLSVEDLFKLDIAFTSNKILGAGTVDAMLSPRNKNSGGNYGYGFTLGTTIRGTKIFGHSGDDTGIGHNVDYLDFPDDHVKIFVASNGGLYSGTSWSAVITSMLQRLVLPSAFTYANLELPRGPLGNYVESEVEQWEGVYTQSENISYHIWLNNSGQLLASPIGDSVASTFFDTKTYTEKNKITRTILEEANRKEFTLLKALTNDNDSFEKMKTIISGNLTSLEKRYGRIQKISILGSANMWSGNYQAEIATWFALTFEKKTQLFRLEWNGNDKVAGLGGSRIRYPMTFILKPAEGEFVGFDVANGRSISIRFSHLDHENRNKMEVKVGDSKSTTFIGNGDMNLLPKRSAAELIYHIVNTKGIDTAKDWLAALKKDRTTRFDIDAGELNDVGYRLLNQNKVNEAIGVFIIQTQEFPENANAFDSLGEAYLKVGDKTLALLNYQKSLQIDPNNKNAKAIVKSLEKSQNKN